MGGPTGHGQRNKAHKAGRAAGLSARQKQRQGKEASAQRQPAKSGVQGGKIDRLVAAKQHRDAKRQGLLDQRRKAGAPIVVAVLPLSEDVDIAQLWNNLLSGQLQPGEEEQAVDPQQQQQDGSMELDKAASSSSPAAPHSPLALTTITIPGKGRGVRLTLLPPPTNRKDLLAVVDIGRAAEVLLLAVPGGETQEGVDEDGKAALSVLRALGLPGLVVAVQRSGEAGGAPGGSMKERSAARKRAEKAICAEIAGDHKVFHLDSRPDCQQLMRYLSDNSVSVPGWRQQRPALMVEDAQFRPAAGAEAGPSGSSSRGSLVLTGYVRYAGLSANQLLHIPGAGDFQIDRIDGFPAAGAGAAGARAQGGMDTSGSDPVLVAQHDPEEREALARENAIDPLDGEQTWPSEQELLDVEKLVKGKARKRTLPEGTSAYQAAWILDDDDEEEEEEEDDEGDAAMGAGSVGGEAPDLADMLDEDEDEDGMGTEGTVMDADDEDADKAAALHEELRSRHRRKQEQEQEQQENPDEVDIPVGVQASTRFQKYRGLKSFRSSPWDSKEWLPQEYAKIFAFENGKRAQKRAKAAMERCTAGLDPCAVLPGGMVAVHVADVPADVAALLLQRVQRSTAEAGAPGSSSSPQVGGSGMPVVAFGLMQHEAKMSVLHMAVKKVNGYEPPLASKEELLLVTGIRTFSARPIFSADTPGDKHKMERFLHPGRNAMASVYAPISYAPLPLLAFKLPAPQEQQQQGGADATASASAGAVLAAAGTVRGSDPDRVILKKITLTGYPVRVHKKKATIRFMFHSPDDIRWFKPVELYTKGGRRGRITEPIGTHGAMKCQFDGPVQQRDVVCMSLYKRAFPKWPSSLSFS